jgi:alkyl sulfatase BDS1-like metallo-beta-lactamase superfamily hydrolase
MILTQDNSRINRSEFLRGAASVGLAVSLATPSNPASAQDAPPTAGGSSAPKRATDATRDVNSLYRKGLPFDDVRDFEDARRGLLGSLPIPGSSVTAKGRRFGT